MRKTFIIASLALLFSTACFALPPTEPKEMSCAELLDVIKKLEKIKAAKAEGNYEVAERIGVALLSGTFYISNRRHNDSYFDEKQEIQKLKELLPNCKPY